MSSFDETKMARRYGWLRLYDVIWENGKFMGLPGAPSKLAYIRALTSANKQAIRGEWASRNDYVWGLGEYRKFADTLIEHDLVTLITDGSAYACIRQWDWWNPPDATSKERSARYRENEKREKDGLPRVYASGVTVTRDDTPDTSVDTQIGDEGTGADPTGVERLDPIEVDTRTTDPDQCPICERPVDFLERVERFDGSRVVNLHPDCAAA